MRFPDEACSVCKAFGAYGWGPPERMRFERRCKAHLWPEWGLPIAERQALARAQDSTPPAKRERQAGLL